MSGRRRYERSHEVADRRLASDVPRRYGAIRTEDTSVDVPGEVPLQDVTALDRDHRIGDRAEIERLDRGDVREGLRP